jgi:diguanylate cyclase (GGDEF)-like protein
MAAWRTRLLGRCGDAAVQAAGLFALSGALAVAAVPISPDRAMLLLAIASVDLLTALVVVACPWVSWPPGRTAVLALPALAVIGVSTWAFGGFAAGTGPFFVLLFAWLGLHHRPSQVIWCTPLAAVAYAVPLLISDADARLVASTVILMPIALGVGLLISARVRALAEAREELAFQAAHDPLTGLPNRVSAMQLLHAALSRAQRCGDLVAVLFIDLDAFKIVNDVHGHRAGDAVLRVVAERLRTEIRAGDTAGRLGGDEFVVVLDSVATEACAVEVADRIVAAVSEPIGLGAGEEARVGASVGIAFNLDGATDAEAVLHDADVAGYRAKNRGRGRVAVFTPRPGLPLMESGPSATGSAAWREDGHGSEQESPREGSLRSGEPSRDQRDTQ